jgi:mono/diheme cytochrome c family protein
MKKAIALSFIALAVLACHRKAVPPANTSSSRMEAPKSDPHATMVAEGKTVYTNNCGKCHGLKPVENYTADRWGNILKSMIPKARLDDTQAQQVTAYVMANAKK